MNACSLHNLKDARAPVELVPRLPTFYLPTYQNEMDAGRGFCWLGKMKRPVCFLDAFAELYCYIWGSVGFDGYMYTAVMLRAGWMQRDNHVRGRWGYLCWRRAQ